MRTRLCCVAAALVAFSATAAAQVSTAKTGATQVATAQPILSEAEALSRLSDDSPRVRAIRSAIAIAQADVTSAARWPNPRVSTDREAVAGVSETLTTVLQPLPISGRRGLEIGAATALVSAATSRADEAVRLARAELRLAYADLSAAQARERELTRTGDQLRSLAEILAKREAAGDAAGFDRLRAEREVLDVDADRQATAADRARAQGALAAFFTGPTDASTLVAADLPTGAAPLPDVATLVEQAERTRGELQALEHERDAAQLSWRAADRRRIPEPEVRAGTKSSTAAGGDVGSVISIQAVLPLFDRGGAERSLAEARRGAALARIEAFRATLRAQVSAVHTAATGRRVAADRYRAAATNTGELERIARVSYEAGERGILELVDAHRTVSSARLRQVALDAAVRQAEIELEFLTGWEIR